MSKIQFKKGPDGALLCVPRQVGKVPQMETLDPKKWFQIRYEVKGYNAEELSIRITKDFVKVKGESKTAMASKSFYKEFVIEKGAVRDAMDVLLDSTGLLMITAPIKAEVSGSAQKQDEDDSAYTTMQTADDQALIQSTKVVASEQTTKSTSQVSTKQKQQTKDTTQQESCAKDEIVLRPRSITTQSTTTTRSTKTFTMRVELKDYAAEEVQVKVTKTLIRVTANHKTETSSRTFSKELTIPCGVKPENIECSMGLDRVLTITAPIDDNRAPDTLAVAKTDNTQTQVSQSQRVTSVVNKTSAVQQVRQESIESRTSTSAQQVQRESRETTRTLSGTLVTHQDSLTPAKLDSILKPLLDMKDESFLTNTEEQVSKDIREVKGIKKFEVCLPIPEEYSPENLCVRVSKHVITVEGKVSTEYSRNEFTKKIPIPNGVKPETIETTLSAKRILTISAPVSQAPADGNQNDDNEVQERQSSTTSSKKVVQESGGSTKTTTTTRTVTRRTEQYRISPAIDLESIVDMTDTRFEDVSNQLCPVATQQGQQFEVVIQVPEYSPDQIQVKISKSTVSIVCRSETTEETKTVTKQILRKFTIPAGVNPEDIVAELTPDGVLKISGPTYASPAQPHIQQAYQQQIQHTNLHVQQQTNQEQVQQERAQHEVQQERTQQDQQTKKQVQQETTRQDQQQTKKQVQQETTQQVQQDTTQQVQQVQQQTTQQVKQETTQQVQQQTTQQVQQGTTQQVQQQRTEEEVLQQTSEQEVQQQTTEEEVLQQTTEEQVQQQTKQQVQQQRKQQVQKQTKQQIQQQTSQQTKVIQDKSTENEATVNKTQSQLTKQQKSKMESVTTETEEFPIQPVLNSNTELSPVDSEKYEDVSKCITRTNKRFEAKLDVKEFRREEIIVKIYKRTVTIETKTTTKRSFCRRISIPDGVNPGDISTTINSAGVLTISGTVREKETNTSQTTNNTQQETQKTTSKKKTINTKIVSAETLSSYNFDGATTSVCPLTDTTEFEKSIQIPQDYKAEEIEVKMAYNIKEFNWVVIEGKQEMTPENNFKGKSFGKMFTVPVGVKLEDVTCDWEENGVLKFYAPILQLKN